MFQTYDIKPEETLLYSRKSRTDDPTLSVEETLAKHEKILDETAERFLGGKVPEENRYREVVSGETIKDRPEVQKILKLIESPRYKAVLIVEVQRLSRGDLEDAGRLIKLLRYTNTLVITQYKIYNLQDEFDREGFERELKRGNEYLEYQKKIMNRGRLQSVKEGNFIGPVAPYGYKKTTIMIDKKRCPTLKINEAEADVVRMIFDLYANQNIGPITIAHKLNELGVKPKKSKLWSHETIKAMLVNEHYIGKVRWNWRQTINIVEDGVISKSRPKVEEYLIYDGRHEAIIPDELFYAAGERKGKNPKLKPRVKLKNSFSGLIYCKCGRAMSYRVYQKKGATVAHPRLVCGAQAYCKTPSCYYDDIMARITEVLENCIEDFEMRIASDNQDAVKLHKNLIARLKNNLEELNKKEINQWEKYTSEEMPKHIFDTLNEKVLKEKDEIQQALCKAYESMPDPVDFEEKIMRFKDALEALSDPDIPEIHKNALLKTCIERIEYTREAAPDGKLRTDSPVELVVKLRI